MSCKSNFSTKIVKLHDTRFYCCEELINSEIVYRDGFVKPGDKTYREYNGKWAMSGLCLNEKIEFCPFCGTKLSINV